MARKDKLLDKLTNPQSSMTWDELVSLMNWYGFELLMAKRGSARKFYHREKDQFVRLHEPHPSKEIKTYVKVAALDALRQIGVAL